MSRRTQIAGLILGCGHTTFDLAVNEDFTGHLLETGAAECRTCHEIFTVGPENLWLGTIHADGDDSYVDLVRPCGHVKRTYCSEKDCIPFANDMAKTPCDGNDSFA
jgi:hypothetical protein